MTSGFERRILILAALIAAIANDFDRSVAIAQNATPIDWGRFTSPALSPFQEDIKHFINKSAGYNLNWVEQRIPAIASVEMPTGRRYDMQTGTEGEIRSLSHIVYSTAAMLKTGAFHSGLTGFEESTFRNRTIEMIHGAALEHKANGTGVQWGNSWQSALWAAHLAEGAWMIWDELPTATRDYVTNMTAYEANRFLNYNVPYWANPDGTLNTPGDTKAEENAWNSRLLSVAVAMMPHHADSHTWRTKASELMVSAFARPSDLQNSTVVDGRPVEDWVNGYNAYETGFVENHGFIHNDYMSTTGLVVQPFITQSLAGQTVPEAAGFNSAVVYDAMATVAVGPQQRTMFQRGPQRAYVPDQYYPQGTDWSLYRYDIFLEMDAFADILDIDSEKSYEALGWGRARLDRILEMQARHADGHLYAGGEFDSWVPREASALHLLTNVWMINWLDEQDAISPQGNWIESLAPPNVSHLTLRIDRTTGEAIILNTSNMTDVALDGYAVRSPAGHLDFSAWTNLAHQELGAWLSANPSANLLSELKASGAITISPGEQLSLGRVFAPPAPPTFGKNPEGDIQFEFSTAADHILEGRIQYRGMARNSTLSLVVDPSTGRALLRNDTAFSPAVEGYLITSASASLQHDDGFWNSLADQGIDEGNWIEANPGAIQIAELNGNGAMVLSPASTFDLGQLFNTSGSQDLIFRFVLAGEEEPRMGLVIYEIADVAGDYNRDGVVDAADYTVWRDTLGQTGASLVADGNGDHKVDANDYVIWKTNFGVTASSDSLSSQSSSVPEPASMILCLMGYVVAKVFIRHGVLH